MRQIPPGSPRRRSPPYCALLSAVRRSRVLAALWRPEPGARQPGSPGTPGPGNRAVSAPRAQGHQRVTERLGEKA